MKFKKITKSDSTVEIVQKPKSDSAVDSFQVLENSNWILSKSTKMYEYLNWIWSESAAWNFKDPKYNL